MKPLESNKREIAFGVLDNFRIEIPSWGFANTGTRFGKFVQAAAASTLEEKFADAAEVHRLTGATPTLALHVLWDLPNGLKDMPDVKQLEKRFGIRSGSINPNLFQDQDYKFGSLCNPSAVIRERALGHLLGSIEIAKGLDSRDISLWMADGSNYPGTQSMRKRIGWLEEALRIAHSHLAPRQRLLVEYKPFEPAFYHTDIADWGMASDLAGRRARRRGCWSIPDIITTRRTSSRLWRGCCTPECWADSTSTTGAMPTTTSRWARSTLTRFSASSTRSMRRRRWPDARHRVHD